MAEHLFESGLVGVKDLVIQVGQAAVEDLPEQLLLLPGEFDRIHGFLPLA